MRITDFYPSQGCFVPGETVSLVAEIQSGQDSKVMIRVYVRHLADEPQVIEKHQSLIAGFQVVCINWMPPSNPAGYAARIELISQNGIPISGASTSFDVLNRWTDFPRYGFLTDFSADRTDPDATLKNLARFHINGLQFYDWQYRHDQLLPPADDYIDPLGRSMSLKIVRCLVDSAHRYGMTALPYLAVYAASAIFWRDHLDWALYDENQKAIPFGEDFLGLMNPAVNSPWTKHLLTECTRALRAIPFDGLHIDQYGEPKLAWDAQNQPVDMPRSFVDFIQAARDQHPDQTILFNAVGNWPIEALSAAPLDFMYIEVWPPDVYYHDLAHIVLDAVHLSHGKPVVIALYLPAEQPENILLSNALIVACSGIRIELGERARLLVDPYFPKHQHIAPDLFSAMRKFYDFVIRNGEWLKPYNLSASEREQWAGGELNPDFVKISDSIWSVVRHHAEALAIQFVNFTGLKGDPRWDEPHLTPTACQNVPVRVQTSRRPDRVFWDCPERSDGPQVLDFEFLNGELLFTIPQLNYTGLIYIHE